MAELLDEYLRHISLERGLSPRTCDAYRRDLEQFLEALEGRDPLAATADDLSDFLWELKVKRGVEARSLARKIESLRSFYAFQAAERRIAKSPVETLRSPKLPSKLPRTLSTDDVERLLSAPADTYERLRTRTMVELLYAAGMRVSELLGLKLESLNLQDGWVRVLGKGSKERLIPIHQRAVTMLRQYLAERRLRHKEAGEHVFLSRRGGPLSRPQFWRDLAALGRAAGLRVKLHPHLFRHTFATHLLRGGADLRSVQELLGHSSLSTTQIYTHVDATALKSAHRRHHPRG